MKGILDIGNGKFFTLIVAILVIYVTWYTQTASFQMTQKITALETHMKIADAELKTDIVNVNDHRKRDHDESIASSIRIVSNIKALDLQIMQINITTQVQQAYDAEQGSREKLMIKVLNEYKEKSNGN